MAAFDSGGRMGDHNATAAAANGHDSAEPRLPDFLIVGAPKAGTSALFAYLDRHPAIYLPPEKEVHFFDNEWDRGIAWYMSVFADAGDRLAGEATPTYLADPDAVDRMAETVPDARLIVVLRDPVGRAHSHYWMQQAKFPDRHGFEELVRAEIADPEGFAAPGAHHRYLHKSLYLPQLQHLTERFPRERLLVLLFEELRADPEGVVRQVFRFLGVDDTVVPDNLGANVNPTRPVRSIRLRRAMLRFKAWKRLPRRVADTVDRLNRRPGYPPLDPDLRRDLDAWFAQHDADLARWLGRDLSTWWS